MMVSAMMIDENLNQNMEMVTLPYRLQDVVTRGLLRR
jgi:hypothetical protein